MTMIKSSGLSVQPCGTPEICGLGAESLPHSFAMNMDILSVVITRTRSRNSIGIPTIMGAPKRLSEWM
eukprot:2650550-Pyramimonas_sp.AAC.1